MYLVAGPTFVCLFVTLLVVYHCGPFLCAKFARSQVLGDLCVHAAGAGLCNHVASKHHQRSDQTLDVGTTVNRKHLETEAHIKMYTYTE
jgi:hypothetical protein